MNSEIQKIKQILKEDYGISSYEELDKALEESILDISALCL